MLLYCKFIGTLKKILVWCLLSVLAIQVAGYIALQFPAVQTFVIQRIIDAASKQIDGKIGIGKVHLIFFNKIILQDISIVSTLNTPQLDSLKENFDQSDTLLSCKKLSISIDAADLAKLQIKLKHINLNGGVFNLQNEGGQGNTNLSRIFRIDKNRVKDTTKKGFPINLLANSLKIKNFRFSLNNPDKFVDKGDSIINFSNLNVSDINVNINNVRIERDTIFGTIKNISGRDKSGFTLKELSGNLELSSTEARIKDIRIADNYTEVNARYFYMQYSSPKDLSDFINLVKLGIDLDDTYFSFKTIGRIAPSLQNSTLALMLNGSVSGPVADLRSRNFSVTSESGQTHMNLNLRMTGLPDIRQAMSVVEIRDCRTTSMDVSKIVAAITGRRQIAFFKKLSPHVKYNFNGNLIGLPDDFVANGILSSNIGTIDVDILLKNDNSRNGFLIQGNVDSKDFDIGSLISNKLLGKVGMNASLSALMSRRDGMEISIDSVRVNKLEFNGYPYSNIFALGKYNNKIFDGKIICHDPNLDFIFQGLFSFDPKATSKYNYYADIPYANLSALNIDKRDSISILRSRMIADFTSHAGKNIVGNINILNTSYANSKGDFNIGTIKLTSKEADSSYNAVLNAPFIHAEYNATAPISSFLKKLASLTLSEHAGAYFAERKEGFFAPEKMQSLLSRHDEYDFSLETSNTRSICELLMPGLYIQDNTALEAHISKEDILDFKLKSGRLAIKQNYLKGLNLNITNRDSLLNMKMTSDNVLIAGIKMDSASVAVKGRDNLLNATFAFKNDSTESNYAFLDTELAFKADTLDIGIKEGSAISFKGGKWSFDPAGIMIADSSIFINRFNIHNGNQLLSADGLLSRNKKDSLAVGLNNFDIKILNLFLNRPFKVEGYFSGAANLSANKNNSNIYLDITGDSVYVYNNAVGVMKLMGKWYQPEKRFNILLSTKLNGKSNLMATGYYKPQNNNILLTADLNDFCVAYFEPFLSDIIAKTSGTLSGKLKLSGPLDKLELDGENCNFNNFKFIVKYTQVPYTLSGPVTLNENGLFSKNLIIKDRFGNSGRVKGGLNYRYFRNANLNTRIEFQNMQCLNTDEKDNEIFYGSAFASGSLDIKGPFNKILLNINVTPAENTAMHIPLSSSATATQTNLLTFVEPKREMEIDPYDTLMRSVKEEKAASQMQVLVRANMNTNAEMLIEINKSLGDIISANGTGPINLDINPSKDVFDVFGDYNINQGKYKFVLSGFGFAAKDFIIQPGGVIHFNGDIDNTTIDLTATYRTKAAINTLIADTSSVSTRRNVNCEIIMSGNLMNPELKFNIDIPDLDPTTKVRVESALNTEGKIQKQFAALLISGGFLPDEQSGITNNSTILYSNVSEMLSNQINNIFQQLGIPLDLGLNYQPGEKGNTDIFDVAVSTQLFNNRLLINGNIGNDPYASSTNDRGVIGNVDVEYKLDKSGKLRIAAFSHAADQYSNYLDDSQRSGIGISYQQEFNRIKDIFRKKSKEQKEYEKRQKALKREERKRAAAERRAGTKAPLQ